MKIVAQRFIIDLVRATVKLLFIKGAILMITTIQHLSIPKEYLHGHNPSKFIALQFAGDDLFPIYQNGDILLVYTAIEPEKDDFDYTIVFVNGNIMIGRFENGKSDRHFQPLNPSLPPISRNECEIIGIPAFLMRDFSHKCKRTIGEVAA